MAKRILVAGRSLCVQEPEEGQLGSRFLDTTIKQDISIELPPKLAEEFRALGILFPQNGFVSADLSFHGRCYSKAASEGR